MTDERETLLTLDQVCEWWQVTPHWVRDMCQQGRLPHTRIGPRKLRFKLSDLNAHLELNAGGTDYLRWGDQK